MEEARRKEAERLATL